MQNLKKMLEGKGVHLLDLASPTYLPGHLVKIHYFWRPGDFRPEVRLDEDRGLATDTLEISRLAIGPRVPSEIVIENVTDQFLISAGVGLPQFGLAANGELKHATTVTWNIMGVETVAFAPSDVQKYFSAVLPSLRREATIRPEIGWVRECFVLSQVFFAQKISGMVQTAGNIDGRSAFAEAGITATSDFSLNWSADHSTFVIQGTTQVPFAARGDAVG